MIDNLTIVIPTLNEANYLPRLLTSIVKQSYKGKLQVIVVDGQSTDKTVKLATGFKHILDDLLIIEAKRDVGHQRNIGASKAKYDYLLFLDADVILPPNIISDLMSKVNINGPFIIGTMHTAPNLSVMDRLFLLFAYMLLFASWILRIPAANGDFILTTKKSHNKINGFVEGALLGEDVDYAIRSVKAGAKYRYFLNPKVIASDRRVREMGRTRLLLLWSRGFLHVVRKGPIFHGEGYEYPFGHYDSKD